MEKEYKVKVIAPFRGLHEGDMLYYNNKNNMFEYKSSDEVVGDNYHSKNSKFVSFSIDFVNKFLGQYFEDLDGFYNKKEEDIKEEERFPIDECKEELRETEQKYAVDIDGIKDMAKAIDELKNEIEELKKTKNVRKKSKKG